MRGVAGGSVALGKLKERLKEQKCTERERERERERGKERLRTEEEEEEEEEEAIYTSRSPASRG